MLPPYRIPELQQFVEILWTGEDGKWFHTTHVQIGLPHAVTMQGALDDFMKVHPKALPVGIRWSQYRSDSFTPVKALDPPRRFAVHR